MKALITFLGEPESNIASTTWGNDATGQLHFPLKEPVLIDSESAGGDKAKFLAHVIAKAKTNRFFKVEDVPTDNAAKPAAVKETPPQARTHPNPKRGATADKG